MSFLLMDDGWPASMVAPSKASARRIPRVVGTEWDQIPSSKQQDAQIVESCEAGASLGCGRDRALNGGLGVPSIISFT
jgi:hypothetical protein